MRKLRFHSELRIWPQLDANIFYYIEMQQTGCIAPQHNAKLAIVLYYGMCIAFFIFICGAAAIYVKMTRRLPTAHKTRLGRAAFPRFSRRVWDDANVRRSFRYLWQTLFTRSRLRDALSGVWKIIFKYISICERRLQGHWTLLSERADRFIFVVELLLDNKYGIVVVERVLGPIHID